MNNEKRDCFEFTDRYKALGMKYPDPKTICKGGCEGTGWVPVKFHEGACCGLLCDDEGLETDPRLIKLWCEAHDKHHKLLYRIKCAWTLKDWSLLSTKCDGWHFVKCPDCNGTGKRIK
jgi:hypothetical protein